jgi:regulation of enolase protein 1 (concanavalin A-like superfamily)
MYRFALRLALSALFVCLVLFGAAGAATAQTLAWDHSAPSTVTGFAVTLDGRRTDYGRQPVASNGTCGCSLTLSLAAGQHTVTISAYNSAGETASAPYSFSISSTTTTPPPTTIQLPSGWLSQDVGAVGVAGTASISSTGVFTIKGAGADIWNTADSFRYVYQPLSGDGTIIARVTGMQNTNTYAKSGIMIRETLANNSAHALLNLRPDGVVEFIARQDTALTTNMVYTTTNAAPVWLWMARNGTKITASTSEDGKTWTTPVSTTVDMGTNIYVGIAVCSHANTTLNLSTFDGVGVTKGSTSVPPSSATPPPSGGSGGAVPSPWTNGDVGPVGLSGSASYSNGVFTVTGAGANVWGTEDGFQYVYRSFSGDGTITARVTSIENSDSYAKAGIMLRGSLSSGAKDVALDVRPNGSIEFMSRSSDGGSTTLVATAGQTPPAWLRLARTGTTATAYVSQNGSSWKTVGSVQIGATAYAGLFVSSHNTADRNTSVFDSVTVAGGTSVKDVVVYASDIPQSALHGAWYFGTGSSSPNGVRLTTPNSSLEYKSAPFASPTHYVDVPITVSAGVPYTIWLRMSATSSAGSNDSVWVQLSNALVSGSPAYRIGTTSGMLVDLASGGSTLNGWGWDNGSPNQSSTVTFAVGGVQTLRLQMREDGTMIDQIVLSPSRYLNQAPGPNSGDTTIVPKP